MTNSRFSDVINAARNRPDQPQEQEATGGPLQGQSAHQAPQMDRSPAPQPQRPAPAPSKRGRPAGGKRNNPDYEQVGAYIPKELNKRVKMRLLEIDKDREFSDLVEFLLKKWLQSGNGSGQ